MALGDGERIGSSAASNDFRHIWALGSLLVYKGIESDSTWKIRNSDCEGEALCMRPDYCRIARWVPDDDDVTQPRDKLQGYSGYDLNPSFVLIVVLYIPLSKSSRELRCSK